MIKDFFILAIKNLRKRGMRSWLTMLGIFISIATIFTLISLSLGLQGAVKSQFETLGTDKFFIMSKTVMLGSFEGSEGNTLTEKDVEVISKINGVKDYSYVTIASGKIELDKDIKYMNIAGVPLDRLTVYEGLSGFGIEDGRSLKNGDTYSIMIGSMYKTGKVFSKPVKVGDTITINGINFKVKGILKPVGNPADDSNIILPMSTFREISNISDRVDEIVVQVNPGENTLDVASKTEIKLRKFRGVTEKTQDFSISTPDELLKSFQTILNIITYFLAGIAGISLVVGGIGIANTMYTSVIERTREIGVMKAVGARNSDILWIFLIESGLLGLVGAGIGVLLGYGISKTIEYIAINVYGTTLLQAAAPLYLIVGCLAFGFIVGALSGIFPALNASKTNVVDALRYE